MGLLCLVYLVASLRTNIIFVIIFATLVIAFGLLAGAYWQIAQGAAALGGRLVIVSCSRTWNDTRIVAWLTIFQTAGAFLWVTCVAGWYIFAAQILACVDFPLALPVVSFGMILDGILPRRLTSHLGRSFNVDQRRVTEEGR